MPRVQNPTPKLHPANPTISVKHIPTGGANQTERGTEKQTCFLQELKPDITKRI